MTMTTMCLDPTWILLSLALTGCISSRRRSYGCFSSVLSVPAIAEKVRTPSSVRFTFGFSAFAHSMVTKRRSLRCAQRTTGVRRASPTDIADMGSVSKREARGMPSGARRGVRRPTTNPDATVDSSEAKVGEENAFRVIRRGRALRRTAPGSARLERLFAPRGGHARARDGRRFPPAALRRPVPPPRFILEYSDDAGKTRTRSVRSRAPSSPPSPNRHDGAFARVSRFQAPSSLLLTPPPLVTPARARLSVSVPEHAPDADAIAREVTRAFPRRLDRSLVRHPQIVRRARRLVDAASPRAGEKTTPEFAADLDLSLVSPEKLVEAKAAMDEGFERNRKAIGDEAVSSPTCGAQLRPDAERASGTTHPTTHRRPPSTPSYA